MKSASSNDSSKKNAGYKAAEYVNDGMVLGLGTGECASFSLDGRNLRLFRMPSSSRAYPMKAERKAEFYQNVFKFLEL